MSYEFRPMEDLDIGFIVTTWMGSLRGSIRWMPRPQYQRFYREAIKSSMNDCKTIVCHVSDAPEVIAGWIHGIPGILHYVYVRPNYRSLSSFPVADQLLEEVDTGGPLLYTHWTYAFRRRLKEHYVYRPDVFRPNMPQKGE